MGKYLKTTFIFFGVWFFAALLNGLLSGIIIAVLDKEWAGSGIGTLALSIFFSFLCSIPLVGLVWFIAIMAQLGDKKGDTLFQFVLASAFYSAIAGALIFMYTLGTEFTGGRYFIGLSIIISALCSVLFFRKQIKTNA